MLLFLLYFNVLWGWVMNNTVDLSVDDKKLKTDREYFGKEFIVDVFCENKKTNAGRNFGDKGNKLLNVIKRNLYKYPDITVKSDGDNNILHHIFASPSFSEKHAEEFFTVPLDCEENRKYYKPMYKKVLNTGL